MKREEKTGLKKALDLLKKMQRYELCWEQMDESKNGEFVKYIDLKKAIIDTLQTPSNNKIMAPQATPKSCPHCGGSPTEKREGQGFCPYCDRYF